MTPNSRSAVYRLVVAALALGAVGYKLFALHLPGGFDPINFFSYFTNLTNIMLGLLYLFSGIALLRGRRPTVLDEALRGAVVVYIVFVGLVFGALLQDVPVGNLNPWVNAVVHSVTPIAAVIEWIAWPPRRRVAWDLALLWILWPAVYVGYTLIRGMWTSWYPYPFFDPAQNGGYGGVALTCAALVVALAVISALVRLRRARPPRPPAPKHRTGPQREAAPDPRPRRSRP